MRQTPASRLEKSKALDRMDGPSAHVRRHVRPVVMVTCHPIHPVIPRRLANTPRREVKSYKRIRRWSPLPSLAQQLLAEKMVDDFYENYARARKSGLPDRSSLTERLKAVVPSDQHDLLFRWEAECNERCGQELREFAHYVAGLLIAEQPLEEPDVEVL